MPIRSMFGLAFTNIDHSVGVTVDLSRSVSIQTPVSGSSGLHDSVVGFSSIESQFHCML